MYCASARPIPLALASSSPQPSTLRYLSFLYVFDSCCIIVLDSLRRNGFPFSLLIVIASPPFGRLLYAHHLRRQVSRHSAVPVALLPRGQLILDICLPKRRMLYLPTRLRAYSCSLLTFCLPHLSFLRFVFCSCSITGCSWERCVSMPSSWRSIHR